MEILKRTTEIKKTTSATLNTDDVKHGIELYLRKKRLLSNRLCRLDIELNPNGATVNIEHVIERKNDVVGN